MLQIVLYVTYTISALNLTLAVQIMAFSPTFGPDILLDSTVKSAYKFCGQNINIFHFYPEGG